jgi:SAM-dependent methyltransferase
MFGIFVALFNRELLKQNRNRVLNKLSQADFIHQETAEIITQTILDCKRNFADVLEIGARSGVLGKMINSKNLIQTDLAINFQPDLVMDDENLCFKEQSFDLVLSNLNLHLINDIPKNLVQIKNLLKPDGLFIASFFGEENLKELKAVFMQVEQEIYGGITPRIAPNIDVKTAGMLLQKAGFVDVVASKHSVVVEYSHPKKLLEDLKNMGEANILEGRSRKFMTKKFLFNLTNLYQKLYCRHNNQYLATFEIIILTGWKK